MNSNMSSEINTELIGAQISHSPRPQCNPNGMEEETISQPITSAKENHTTIESTKNHEENKTIDPHPHRSHSENSVVKHLEGHKHHLGFPSYTFKWKNHSIKIDEDIKIKIVDFGNGCWVNKHFTDNIQTREYRSPEAILGIPYKANTDLWSLACVLFELITSSFLFKPSKGDSYGKDDDHLALMVEHLGKMPKNFALKGKESRNYFNKNAQLIRIKELKETTISDAIVNTLDDLSIKHAKEIEEVLLPMLEYDPEKRINAKEALELKWFWEPIIE